MSIEYPKILIISNECLSRDTSNGRSLGNFFINYDRNSVANFCIKNTAPDFECCNNFYNVTDCMALKSMIFGHEYYSILRENVSNEQSISIMHWQKVLPRNSLTMLIRNFVWKRKKWCRKNFWQWVESFNPDIILLQAGDCPFMFELAQHIAEKYNIPLIQYNTEGYYFFKDDYFRSKFKSRLCYLLFHNMFIKQFDETMKRTSYCIYSNEVLLRDYSTHFKCPAQVLYTSYNPLVKFASSNCSDNVSFTYLGNLGLERHISLIEVANALHRISSNYYVDVYGKGSPDVLKEISKCEWIHYHGVIPYEKSIKVIENSEFLLHVESFNKHYFHDMKYAFSTKIADSLASGKCLIVYAPQSVGCCEYLEKTHSAHVISNPNDLYYNLQNLLNNKDLVDLYVHNAKCITSTDHDPNINARKFQNILLEVSGSKKC